MLVDVVTRGQLLPKSDTWQKKTETRTALWIWTSNHHRWTCCCVDVVICQTSVFAIAIECPLLIPSRIPVGFPDAFPKLDICVAIRQVHTQVFVPQFDDIVLHLPLLLWRQQMQFACIEFEMDFACWIIRCIEAQTSSVQVEVMSIRVVHPSLVTQQSLLVRFVISSVRH